MPPTSGVTPGLRGTINSPLRAMMHRSVAGVRSLLKNVMAASVCAHSTRGALLPPFERCEEGVGVGGGTNPPNVTLGTRPAGGSAVRLRAGVPGQTVHAT
jgi:hypothetical protein